MRRKSIMERTAMHDDAPAGSLPSPATENSAAAEADSVDLSVAIGGLRLGNPVMPASGCFGPEIGGLVELSGIGASVTKTVFLDERRGNAPDRLTENRIGMFNSVGIPSRGPAGYLADLHPRYRALGIPVITSIGAHRPPGYAAVLRELGDAADAYELNVSCPNLDNRGVEIGADPRAVEEAVGLARLASARPLIVKLSPLVSSIGECAAAAERAGADAVCVSNSIPTLPIDPVTLRPMLGNGVAGLSGPAIRAVITRLVWLTAQAVGIPVIACGGIESTSDALEYFAVGASAVQIGTASFGRPRTLARVATGLGEFCRTRSARTIREAIETLHAATA